MYMIVGVVKDEKLKLRECGVRSVRADEFRKSAGHSQIKEIKKPSLRWEYTSYEI
jgi:hypothetical protein